MMSFAIRTLAFFTLKEFVRSHRCIKPPLPFCKTILLLSFANTFFVPSLLVPRRRRPGFATMLLPF